MQFSSTGIPKTEKVKLRGYEKPLAEIAAMFSQPKDGPEADKDRLREMAQDIDYAVQSDMYNSLYVMSSMTADMIGDKLDELVAMGPEGEKELELMLGQLEAQNDSFESFTKSVMGDPGSDLHVMATMGAAKRRLTEGVDHIGRVNFTTPYEEMQKREERYTDGSIADRVVWDGQNIVFYKGNDKVDMADVLNPNVFASDIEAIPPISGADFFSNSYVDGLYNSEEEVRELINESAENEDVKLDIAQVFVDQQKKTNPGFNQRAEDVMNTPKLFEFAKEAYIKDAIDKFNSMGSEPEKEQVEAETSKETDSVTPDEKEREDVRVKFNEEMGGGAFEEARESFTGVDRDYD